MMQEQKIHPSKLPTKVTSADDDESETNSSKQQQLNRFLSKTYHMVNSDETSLVCWAPGGDSFLILDSEKFATTILPKYFKHSKFTSFVRQLNFYGFRKIRNTGSKAIVHDDDDHDDEEGSEHGEQEPKTTKKKQPTMCRFYHEFFQAGRPELLHRIQRATKSAEPPSPGQVEHLRFQLESMKERMDKMSTEFDSKLQKMKTNIEHDYQRRFAILEASYKDLLTHVLRDRISGGSVLAGSPAAASSALRGAAFASMASSMPETSFSAMGSGLPPSLMFSSLSGRNTAGGLYSNTGGGMQNLLRNTNPAAGSSDMSAFGMLGKFR